MKTLTPEMAAFLAETQAPSILGHDDAMILLRPITVTLNKALSQAGEYRRLLDDAHLAEAAQEPRAYLEELYQTIGAIQRLTGEAQERIRQLAQAEKQLDQVRDRLLAGLESSGFTLPDAPAAV